MQYCLKTTPEDLERLMRRITDISEDLQKDTVEIQYLLCRVNAAVSGSEAMIEGAKSEIEHCKQLADILKGISDDLRKIYAEYLNAEQAMLERINQSLRNNVT